MSTDDPPRDAGAPEPTGADDKRQQMDEIRTEYRSDQAQTSGRLTSVGPVDAPRRLHHYTTLEGIVGITSSGSVWASDVRYLNDASELTYARELIAEVVRETLSKVTDAKLKPVLPERHAFADSFEYGSRPFITCFCEQGDLLSQWRGYRRDQTGYSLGLDLSTLSTFGDLPANTYLRRVIYDEELQRSEVSAVVEQWVQSSLRLLDSGAGLTPPDLFPYPAIWALQEALIEHHLCYKHPTFAEEREWRLIKLVNVREELRLLDRQRTDEMLRATNMRMAALGVDVPSTQTAWGEADAEGVEIRFRKSPVGLVPYVDLPLHERAGVFTGRLPLWHVVQGPTPTPELALESVGMYLESCGYGFHTSVESSTIPLRY